MKVGKEGGCGCNGDVMLMGVMQRERKERKESREIEPSHPRPHKEHH